MTPRRVQVVAATGFALLVVGALVAPALVFDSSTARGGAARAAGWDLVVAGALVGCAYAAYLHRVLRRPGTRQEVVDRWLSCTYGLIVLAVTASALPAVVLHETALLHAVAADAEWPVAAGWAAVLVVAACLAEVLRRASLRWLAADRRTGK